MAIQSLQSVWVTPSAPLQRLLTLREVAHALAVSSKTIERLCRSGQLNYLRIGRSLRFRQTAVEMFMAARDSARGMKPTRPKRRLAALETTNSD